jgi:ribosome maturation protein SDO1
VCVVDAVFKNHNKGERFSDAELLEAFGTSDMTTVLQTICEKGEVQQNANDRKKLMEQKRLQVVQYLAKYYIDPT